MKKTVTRIELYITTQQYEMKLTHLYSTETCRFFINKSVN